MTSDNMLKGLLKNETELFLETLGSFTLIDIGVIESINDKGRAVVLSNQYVANQRVVYQDAEVVYPGNARGAYAADCSGSACLILYPYTCMPDTTTRNIRPSSVPYHKDGIKVIPIGNGSQSAVKQVISTAGDYSISTKTYVLSFDRETISLTQGESLSIVKDAEGNVYLRHKNENTGACLFSLDKNGIFKSYSSTDGSVVWEDTLDTTGARTFTQKDNSGNVLSQLMIDAEGKLTMTLVADVSISTEGNVDINTEGDANITVGGDVTIDADGDVGIKSGKSIAIDADTNIKFGGSTKHLVTYEALNAAMTKLYTALTTTPIVGNGSMQPTWVGLNPVTGIDISGSKADSLLTK